MKRAFQKKNGAWSQLDETGWSPCDNADLIAKLNGGYYYIRQRDGDREYLLSKISDELFINVTAHPEKGKLREQLKALCQQRGLDVLYHFTDQMNVPSIRERGLYSWKALASLQIPIPRPGGNDLSRNLDRRYGLQDYVRLCFNPKNHPMLSRAMADQRIVNPVFIRVPVDVTWWHGTLFSLINATDNLAAGFIGPNIKHLAQCRTDICLSGNHNTYIEAKLYQAEVLVKTHISPEHLAIQE
jgi:hypothetical protein